MTTISQTILNVHYVVKLGAFSNILRAEVCVEYDNVSNDLEENRYKAKIPSKYERVA